MNYSHRNHMKRTTGTIARGSIARDSQDPQLQNYSTHVLGNTARNGIVKEEKDHLLMHGTHEITARDPE